MLLGRGTKTGGCLFDTSIDVPRAVLHLRRILQSLTPYLLDCLMCNARRYPTRQSSLC